MRTTFDITPLGTSSAAPMHGRHLSSVLVRLGSAQILIDCGEGTQFQLANAPFKPRKFSVVLISHMHGDHWYGLPGLLASLSLGGRKKSLQIVGPDLLARTLRVIPGLSEDDLSYSLEFISTDTRNSFTLDDGSTVSWASLDHSVPCVGFRIQEADSEGNLNVEKARAFGIVDFLDFQRLKDGSSVENKLGQVVEPSEVVSPGLRGRVFSYVSDTRPCANGVELGREADLLIHEATFMRDMQERAEETGHSTALEAAQVARDANAKRLLLTHFSARYEDPEPLAIEAREVFPETWFAEELVPVAVRLVGQQT